MANKVIGYNIALKLGTKKIAGTTADNFTTEGRRKESIMKSDQGNKQYENDGVNMTFSVQAFLMKTEVADTGLMGIGDLRKAAAENQTAAFVYGGEASGDDIVTGTAMFLRVSETSDSENFATVTIDLELIGDPVFTTVAP